MTNNYKRTKDTQLIALLVLIPMLIFSFYLSVKFKNNTMNEDTVQSIQYNKK
ncbi:hypothetical protein [Clostridium sp. CCUG 7971]|uniref:hypothetical protein n=1 Tax=Clostridium sp. CCUG 7971 TaxID=2811414 RepID=UPI001ABA8E6D|nr:hypothetical protein [Clostridium sp. CCUG 7971]MBO3445939.1 hypothetical protein [Clostridium sp. CCUG 7971]